ncbi:MAG: hypothetical protein ACUVRL_05685 [Candidatus Saccharicenans sp.]|uniref:hypothetical protein n=1 Tax=Candidatus Saccharicenans sp. TaxID=2819258 RepID=UPI00404A184A
MDSERYLKNLERVAAPAEFEAVVLSRVRERKAKRVRLRRLEFSLAGAAALLLVGILIFAPGLRKSPVSTMAGINPEGQQGKVIHVVEPLDLRQEMRRAASESQTMFILEQVSDSWIQQISY